ncbi:MAG: hypothetical protein LBH24_05975 [Clostridiales bacterium]|jgi:alpha-mannosidase|nr:hypothetical protein [Clostridiales bacterium]
MDKKQLNIAARTHWDREWCTSPAKCRYRLVRLMDTLSDMPEPKKIVTFELEFEGMPA